MLQSQQSHHIKKNLITNQWIIKNTLKLKLEFYEEKINTNFHAMECLKKVCIVCICQR